MNGPRPAFTCPALSSQELGRPPQALPLGASDSLPHPFQPSGSPPSSAVLQPGEASAAEPTAARFFLVPFRLVPLEDGPGPLTILDTLAVCKRWREALISRTNDLPSSVRQMLSGHAPSGEPLQEDHLAFLPVAPQAGAGPPLLGLAAAIPSPLAEEDIRQLFLALGRVDELALGRFGRWRLEYASASPEYEQEWIAHQEALCGPATHWASVTPIVFDRHPKAKDEVTAQRQTAAMIEQACIRAGLPPPSKTTLALTCAHAGLPPAHAFPRLARGDGRTRRHSHVFLAFPRPVAGPMLLGAGRYAGYGLCKAIHPPFAEVPRRSSP